MKSNTVEKPKNAISQTTVRDLLLRNKMKIETALPKHLPIDKMLSFVANDMRKNPKLTLCTEASLIGAIIQSSQLGLIPGSVLGHAYLIPYDKKKKLDDGTWVVEKTECQFIVGYRGMIDLARRSGQVIYVDAHEVRDGDIFNFEYGFSANLKHAPAKENKDNIYAYWACANFTDNFKHFQVMWNWEIEEIKAMSKAANNGPWVTNPVEMGKKTVIRRLFKYLPVSIEMQKAITLDESAERGEQDNSLIFEGEYESLNEEVANNKKTKAEALVEKLNSKQEIKNNVKPISSNGAMQNDYHHV